MFCSHFNLNRKYWNKNVTFVNKAQTLRARNTISCVCHQHEAGVHFHYAVFLLGILSSERYLPLVDKEEVLKLYVHDIGHYLSMGHKHQCELKVCVRALLNQGFQYSFEKTLHCFPLETKVILDGWQFSAVEFHALVKNILFFFF